MAQPIMEEAPANDAVALAIPVLLNVVAGLETSAILGSAGEGEEPQLRGLQGRAALASLASVLASTCRGARSSVDAAAATIIGDAARRSALGQQAASMSAVYDAVTELLQSDEPGLLRSGIYVQGALIGVCGTSDFIGCSAAQWRAFGAQVLAMMKEATEIDELASSAGPAAMGFTTASEHPFIQFAMLNFETMVDAFMPVDGASFDDVCALLERGPAGADTEDQDEESSSSSADD